MTNLTVLAAVSQARAQVSQLTTLGHQWVSMGTTQRHRLLHLHFVRLSALVYGALTLVEVRNPQAAFALDKSILDTLFGGLYIGYAIDDAALQENIKKGAKGRGTPHPSWTTMAKAVDEHLYVKKPVFRNSGGSLLTILDKYREQANTFQHGGLFSIVLQDENLPAALLENFVNRCVGTMIAYLNYVAMFEGIAIDELRGIRDIKASAGMPPTTP
jgi:hypothetical protein